MKCGLRQKHDDIYSKTVQWWRNEYELGERVFYCALCRWLSPSCVHKCSMFTYIFLTHSHRNHIVTSIIFIYTGFIFTSYMLNFCSILAYFSVFVNACFIRCIICMYVCLSHLSFVSFACVYPLDLSCKWVKACRS